MHVVITGASSGIGEAIARFYGAREGARLTLAARRVERLEAIAEGIDAECFVCPTDLSDLEQCGQLIERARARFGPIDVLINNAGVQYVEPTVDVTPERGERLFTVDLLAPMRLIHYVLPEMLERKRGAIVNIASMAGLIFTPGMCHYNAAKAGLAAASESLRAELRGSGVHVLTVYPGPVHSEMESAARQKFEDASSVDKLPTGEPDELATLIARAIEREQERVVYPRIYTLGRMTRNLSQWITDRYTPGLK